MKKEELLQMAAALGIEDTESLSYNELQSKVAQRTKEKKAESLASVKNAATDSSTEATVSKGSNQGVGKIVKDSEENEGNSSTDVVGTATVSKEPSGTGEDIVKKEQEIRKGFDEIASDLQEKKELKTFFEDERGTKYVFRSNAPKSFRYNGEVKTQEEWLQDEDAMEQLSLGKSIFIQKIKNPK